MLAVESDNIVWFLVSTKAEILKLMLCQVTEVVNANSVGSNPVLMVNGQLEIILEYNEVC